MTAYQIATVLPIIHFPGGSAGKECTCNVGDLGSIPGLGGSLGKVNDYPLSYSGLENSTDDTVPIMQMFRLRNFGLNYLNNLPRYLLLIWEGTRMSDT